MPAITANLTDESESAVPARPRDALGYPYPARPRARPSALQFGILDMRVSAARLTYFSAILEVIEAMTLEAILKASSRFSMPWRRLIQSKSV